MREGRNVEQQQNNKEPLLGEEEGPSTSHFDQYKLGDCWKSQFSCNLILIPAPVTAFSQNGTNTLILIRKIITALRSR